MKERAAVISVTVETCGDSSSACLTNHRFSSPLSEANVQAFSLSLAKSTKKSKVTSHIFYP